MSWLLDTNACVNYLRAGAGSPLAARLTATHADQIVSCSVVKAELMFGALKSREASANLAKVRTFLAAFESLPFDDVAAEAYGEIRAALTRQGAMIGPNDLLIAAIAKSHDLTLVTHNVDEFGRVSGLRVEDWEE